MSKIRVHEYAKKYNVSSKDVISKLKEMNIEVSNHMTMLDDDVVGKIRPRVSGKHCRNKKLQNVQLWKNSTRKLIKRQR
ncbi:hypothetical protein GCM10020331_048420 [Ectobacillus funiculus]